MYLNQKALWSRISQDASCNPFGDIVHADSIQIDVRKQDHVEEVRLKDGTVRNTNFIYYTYKSVNVGDRIDGNLVVSSYIMRTLGGRERLRRVLTV